MTPCLPDAADDDACRQELDGQHLPLVLGRQSNLLLAGDWGRNRAATQTWGRREFEQIHNGTI